jgi:predicted metal-dependent hydrolase
MPSTGPPTPRRIRFAYPDDLDPMWTPATPEFACAANAVSLMMPIIEPYFVRTIAAAAETIDRSGPGPDAGPDADPGRPPGPHRYLPDRDEVEAYLAQERAHHGQHRRFNRLLVARYPRLAAVERVTARVYGALERRASPGFNLAVVTASETMAYSAARWADRHRRELFDRADPVAATLFLWHLAEEVEHKSSAHDVHRAVEGGRRWFRVRLAAAMVTALALVMVFVAAGTTVMLAGERRLHHPVAWARLTRWSVVFAFELLTNLAVSLLPGHHPSDFADPLWYEVWLRTLDADTGSLPLWSAATGIAEPAEPAGPDGPDRSRCPVGLEPGRERPTGPGW